ncbi:SirB1 family protein [Agarivorans sp. MS3-6]|uniref:SirB1 family protein n=1 Tax=Agarivorans sp. TSD2052 TaxID=2937286 RepID=UPI0020100ECD|nr:tetratricopeptide repeat protein [Agarivorans sp. TSD2052]UPW19915.1 tetratricopeptide repeat protein [Agarivorans sp. TSD2052]
MIFRILGLEEEISGQSFALVRKTLHRLWLDWLKLNPIEDSPEQRFEQLKNLFYKELGFSSDWQSYYHSKNSLISDVLSRRCGNGTSLSVLLHYFARKLDIECHAIAFPAQTILAFSLGTKCIYFDAFSAEQKTVAQLEVIHRGHKGNLARLLSDNLEPMSSADMTKRWLGELKSACLREDEFERALQTSQILIRLKPGDPHEMRDRGFIYQQLDCNSVAINDFEYFIEQCPDDPLSKILKVQIHTMDSQPAILH